MARMEYPEARDALDLSHVWDMAPNPNGTPFPERGGVVKSPFRTDKKGASFSVKRDLKEFKDHVDPDHKGGVYKFISLCQPSWEPRDIVRHMIRLAGGDPDAKDPDWKPKTKTEWKAEQEKKRTDAIRKHKRDQRMVKPLSAELLDHLPPVAAGRWKKNLERASCEWCEELAAERGWPLSWVMSLVDMGLLGCTPKGDPSFAVERYCHKKGGYSVVGLHERWIDEKEGKKNWSYRPCLKWDKVETAAFPFRLGSLQAPLWIITEGQWDAATVYGLIGGFSEHMQIEAFVVGIRGASGIDLFLSAYDLELRSIKPKIVLMPDRDAAAKRWTEDQKEKAGALPKWSLSRKIREVYGLSVHWLKTRRSKDVNDAYKEGHVNSENLGGILSSIQNRE